MMFVVTNSFLKRAMVVSDISTGCHFGDLWSFPISCTSQAIGWLCGEVAVGLLPHAAFFGVSTLGGAADFSAKCTRAWAWWRLVWFVLGEAMVSGVVSHLMPYFVVDSFVFCVDSPVDSISVRL